MHTGNANPFDKMIREQTSDELSIHHIDLSLNALNNIGFLIRRHNYTSPEAVHGFMKNTCCTVGGPSSHTFVIDAHATILLVNHRVMGSTWNGLLIKI